MQRNPKEMARSVCGLQSQPYAACQLYIMQSRQRFLLFFKAASPVLSFCCRGLQGIGTRTLGSIAATVLVKCMCEALPL